MDVAWSSRKHVCEVRPGLRPRFCTVVFLGAIQKNATSWVIRSALLESLSARTFEFRRGGRVVECAGLEIQCTFSTYRRFESDPLRH